MHAKSKLWAATLVGAVAISTSFGCRKNEPDPGLGTGSATINASVKLGSVGVRSVCVNIRSSSMPSPLVITLTGTGAGGQFGGVVGNLPIGNDYVFACTAYDGDRCSGNDLFAGSATNVSIEKKKSASVIINLNQTDIPDGGAYEAPTIDSLTASALSVAPGDQVTISVTGHDPQADQTPRITWSWEASCGTLGAATPAAGPSSTIRWTAPSNDSSCQINILAADVAEPTLQNRSSLTITVSKSLVSGSAAITANVNSCPQITKLTATNVPIRPGNAGPDMLKLSGLASDPDMNPVNYRWSLIPNVAGSANAGEMCVGTFGDANAADTTFVLDAASTMLNCTFKLAVNDGTWPSGPEQGQVKCSVSNHVSLPVTSGLTGLQAAPVFGFDHQQSVTIQQSQTVGFAVEIRGGCGGPQNITTAWTATLNDSDFPVTTTTPQAIGLGTPFTTAATIVGTSNDPPGPVVTVTASCTNDPSLTASHVFIVTAINDSCAGQPEGADCTQAARLTNKCIQAAACKKGTCTASAQVACKASGSPCKDNVCDKTDGICKLQLKADGTVCDDGQTCTTSDRCVAGTCTGTAKLCPSSSACMVGSCDPTSGKCIQSNAPTTATCNDGLSCTTGDHCDGKGRCTGAPKVCPGASACVLGACDPVSGACIQTNAPATTTCNDGQACTTNDHCDGNGACTGTPKACPSSGPCVIAACDPSSGACTSSNAPAATACNDGSACTTGDQCDGRGHCAGIPRVCSNPSACLLGSCDPTSGNCVSSYAPVTTVCDDGLLCTTSDHCDGAGRCTGSPKVCPTPNACVVGTCDPASGSCTNSNAPAATACNDGQPCTVNDQCDDSGICAGTPKVCPNPSACLLASCEPTNGNCVNSSAPATTVCDDGLTCTLSDHCDGQGHCTGAKKTCPSGLMCSESTTPAGDCVAIPSPKPVFAKNQGPTVYGIGIDGAGNLWATGNFYGSYDFGKGTMLTTVPASSADAYLIKLSPSGATLEQWHFFDSPRKHTQTSTGLAIARNGNVAVIGGFNIEIDFNSKRILGTPGVDYLLSTGSQSYYALISGRSTGGDPTPIFAHMAGLGAGGSLTSVGSNPTQDAFAICGKTSASVGLFTPSDASKNGILLPTAGSAGGDGKMDIVVAKISAVDGKVLWGKQFGGVGDQICSSVTLDGNGDVVLTGAYDGVLDFGGATAAFPEVAGMSLLYVAKLDGATGAAKAARTWGAAGTVISKVAVDPQNNVGIAGTMTGVGAGITFSPTVGVTYQGGADLFSVRLDGSLNPLCAFADGDATSDQFANALDFDSEGNLHIAGGFLGSLPALGKTSLSTTGSNIVEFALDTGCGVRTTNQYGNAAGLAQVNMIAVADAASIPTALQNSIWMAGKYAGDLTFDTAPSPTTISTGDPTVTKNFYARQTP